MANVNKLLQIGDTAPDFTLPDAATGQEYRLAQWAGRDVLLVFFRGTWCPFCREQMRLLRDNEHRLTASGVQAVGVLCQSRASLRRWLEDHPQPYPLLADEGRDVAKAYRVHYWLSWEGVNLARPSVFILDGERRLTFCHIGRNMADLSVTAVMERFIGFLGDGAARAGA